MMLATSQNTLAHTLTELGAAHAAAHKLLLDTLAQSLPEPAELLALLPEALRAGSPDHYCRHLLYADPGGAYSMMFLVWRPGQHSPVHGHQSWCTYKVLSGDLHEEYFTWDDATETAVYGGCATRRPGDVVKATPGLRQIHRLGNPATAEAPAISLHIYGVDQAHISTGVNLVIPPENVLLQPVGRVTH